MRVGPKTLFGLLDDALSSPVTQRSEGMSPRVGLDTSPRASRKFIINPSDHHHQQAAAGNSFTSALDASPLRPTPLRRRGSDGDSPRYRDRFKYPSMDSPTDPHPLRKGSTTARAARYDTGSTRPRLSRVLSPSTPALVRPPSPAGFPPLDRAESHRTVLAHEVLYPSMPTFPPSPPPCPICFRKKKHPSLPVFSARSRQMTRSRASP